ncbi:peptigoglycan-binding protein LysM [Alcanivorax profundi]|uniref:Peptigoglycan-binding protein LysM n=1 Tax=Alcanivorax profundi TaxID=2338368 RepID=A0A418Y3P0_9GAMM|nr:FimV/HubP family polar landmark protein [Alcanivorax profundi]RJG20164.1 peptigoglycan-binding protein LysM [Alcanivorax profundi]
MLRKLGLGFTALALMTPGIAAALGVGEYELNSYLNQPLDMEVSLHEVGDLTAEEILVNLAPQTEFDAAGVDRTYFLNRLEFAVEVTSKDKAVLHITTDQPVREPYLNFLVEFLWPTGRLMREYTVLLDPPSFAETTTTTAPVITRAPQPVSRTPAPSPAPAPAPASRAPAPASAPVALSPTSPPAASGPRKTYTVKSSDTMWQIALNNRPANSVSVQQMLVAIQEMNPDAFINNNVNLVREGTVLRIPSEQEVRNISTRSALAEVADQNRKWRDMLEERGVQVPQQRAQLDGSRQVADADDSTDGPQKGQVKLVAPESAAGVGDGDSTGSSEQGNANTAVLENELAIRDETLDQLDRENAELKSRLNDLQEQNTTSEQLLKLRNDQISQLQEELRKLREAQGIESGDDDPLLTEPAQTAEAVEEPEEVASEPEAESDEAAASSGADDLGEEMTEDAGDAEDAVSSTEAVAEAQEKTQDSDKTAGQQSASEPAVTKAPEVVKPKPAAPAKPPVAAQSGIVDLLMDNLIYIALGLVAVLAVIFLLLRGKKKEEDETAFFDEADSNEDQDEFGLQLDDEPGSPAAETAVEADDADEALAAAAGSQDPMEDVDVYVAYGRYPQAVDFLRNEINKHPQRDDLKIRLLELLKEMNDEAGFQQQATAFSGVSGDVDAAISRLGGDVSAVAADTEEELSLDDLEMGLSSDLDEPEIPTMEADTDEVPTMEPEQNKAEVAAAEDELADFDFELDDSAAGSDDQTLILDEATENAGDDFTLTLDEPEAEQPSQPELSEADKQSLSASPLLDLDDVGSASFEGDDDTQYGDLSLDDMSSEFTEVSEEPAKDEELDLSLDDLELDGDDAGDSKVEQEDTLADLDLELDEAEKALDADASVDLDDITALDFDAAELESPAAEVAGLATDEDELSLEDLVADDSDDVLNIESGENAPTDTLDVDLDDASSLDEVSFEAEPEVPVNAPEPVAEAPAADVAGSDDDMLSDEDDFDFLGETDENATKLDLAKAYIDMGDSEGAKDILNEVIAEGNDQQQAEARELMSQVG